MRFLLLLPVSLLLCSCGLVLDTSPPDERQDGGPVETCSNASDCDDGLFCNGFEDCVEGICQTVGHPACDDDVECTSDSCDEVIDACRHEVIDDVCQDDTVCHPQSGCVPRVPCMFDNECDDGNACTVGDRCGEDLYCLPGLLRACPSRGCLRGVCDEDSGECAEEPNDSACVDALLCTIGSCSDSGSCVQEREDDLCGDPFTCTEDRCLGIRVGQNDTTGCVHKPEDSVCDMGFDGCAEDVCAPGAAHAGSTTGCTIRVPPGACGEDERCELGMRMCEKLPSPGEGCSDGDPCNGLEMPSPDGARCVTTGHCPEPPNMCLESVCVDGVVRGCGTRLNPDRIDVCLDAIQVVPGP